MEPGKFLSTIFLVFLFGIVYAEHKPEPEPQKDTKNNVLEQEKMQIRSLSMNTLHTLKAESQRWEDKPLITDLSNSEEKISNLQLNKPLDVKQELSRSFSRWEDSPIALK